MAMRVDLDGDVLRTFVAVADCLSFTAAARHVHRTQSAISQQMKRLEDMLGVILFERRRDGLELTREGSVFLAHARRILRLHDDAVAAIRHENQQQILRLGMPTDYAEVLLPRLIPALAERYPAVRLDITCDMSALLLRDLSGGALDLALTIHAPQCQRGEVLCFEPLAWATAPGTELNPAAPLPLALFPEPCPFRSAALAALTAAGRDWRIAFTSQSPTGLRIAVEHQGALALTTERTLPRDWRRLDKAGEFSLPRIPAAELELHIAPAAPTDAADICATLLREMV
jgi:DNA-binding transcriptional LysR family regulator